eukprot:5029559-Amphidinium_carterae.1
MLSGWTNCFVIVLSAMGPSALFPKVIYATRDAPDKNASIVDLRCRDLHCFNRQALQCVKFPSGSLGQRNAVQMPECHLMALLPTFHEHFNFGVGRMAELGGGREFMTHLCTTERNRKTGFLTMGRSL